MHITPATVLRPVLTAAALIALASTTACAAGDAERRAAPGASRAPTAVEPPATSGLGSPPARRSGGSAGGAAVPGVIPREWTLQPADLSGAVPTAADDGPAHLLPPKPCGPEHRYPSTARRAAAAAVQATVGYDEPGAKHPSVVFEYLSTFRDGGAAAFMTELRDALRRCAAPAAGRPYAWKVEGQKVAGDDAVLVRMTEDVTMGGPVQRRDTWIAVVRTGSTVLSVADSGWETASGSEDRIRLLAKLAVKRVEMDR